MRYLGIVGLLLLTHCALRESMPCNVTRDDSETLLEMTYRPNPTSRIRSTVIITTAGDVELNLLDRRRYCVTFSEEDLTSVSKAREAIAAMDLRQMSSNAATRDRGACFTLVIPGREEKIAALCGDADFSEIQLGLDPIHDTLIKALGEPMTEALEAIPALKR